jgi:hypothetical protein
VTHRHNRGNGIRSEFRGATRDEVARKIINLHQTIWREWIITRANRHAVCVRADASADVASADGTHHVEGVGDSEFTPVGQEGHETHKRVDGFATRSKTGQVPGATDTPSPPPPPTSVRGSILSRCCERIGLRNYRPCDSNANAMMQATFLHLPELRKGLADFRATVDDETHADVRDVLALLPACPHTHLANHGAHGQDGHLLHSSC